MCYDLDNSDDTFDREVGALLKLSNVLECKRLMIIKRDSEQILKIDDKTIEIILLVKTIFMRLPDLKHLFEVLTARSFLTVLMLFVAAVGSVRADNTPEYTLQCEGIERVYRLHIPENMPENGPLVIVLHGYGNPTPDILNETADRHRFAVCYPQGEKDGTGKTGWNVGYPFQHDMTIDDVEFLTQLVRHLQQKHGFSKQNVFCVGMSNGGEMCYQLAAREPDLFAAVAPVSGLMMEWLYKSDNSTHPVSLFEIHGTDDKISVWEGDPDNKGGDGGVNIFLCPLPHTSVRLRTAARSCKPIRSSEKRPITAQS